MKGTISNTELVPHVSIQVRVPENVDRLIRELCKLDGTDITGFYQRTLLDGLAGYLNCDPLLDSRGLAEIHGLHILRGLDPSMFGEYPEAKE